MTTVGEPIEPDVWRCYHSVVGKGEAVIVDTWWQTENGGFLGSTLPALSRAVEMYVSLKPGFAASKGIADKVVRTIETEIGKITRPKNVWIVPDMPKTRSGKIMRRVIAAVSNFADVGDTTTLANPEIVEDIRRHVQNEKVARGEVPRKLSTQELEELKAFGRRE